MPLAAIGGAYLTRRKLKVISCTEADSCENESRLAGRAVALEKAGRQQSRQDSGIPKQSVESPASAFRLRYGGTRGQEMGNRGLRG
jgi:hypothetical protein